VSLRRTAADAVVARDLGRTLPDPGWGVELTVGKPRYATLLACSLRQVLALTGAVIGAVDEQWPAPRPLTSVEESLAVLLFDDLVAAAIDGWPGKDELPIERRGIVARPVRTRLFPSRAQTLVSTFSLDSNLGHENCYWVVPEEGIADLLKHCELGTHRAATSKPAPQLEAAAVRMPVELVVQLGQAEVTMAQLSRLQAGDLLLLDQCIADPLLACVGGRSKFRGWPGRTGLQQSFQIVTETNTPV
jgi:flagellar motor switch protein FliM